MLEVAKLPKIRLEEQKFSKRSKLEIWVFFKLRCVFQKNTSIFKKSLKVANLPEHATELVRFSKRSKLGVFFSKDR